ncbi:MAG: hypothetical protein IJ419_07530 [Agathobacter sp.]|nr:hypothetical protein [Agathobacter sp.]
MSKKIPQEELNKKVSYRLKKWFTGESDTYVDILESKPQDEVKPNQNLIKSHQKDQALLLESIHDTKNNKIYKNFFRFYKVTAVVCCIALVTILLVAVSYLPPVGNPNNPAHNEVVDKYVEDGLQDTGAVNIVTGMILDYRAFDTFGESNVLFIATCTVLILMRNDKKKSVDHEHSDRHFEPKSDAILQKITFVLFPIIVIYGIYVVLNGHLSPGGGFSGGAIIGAGLILYLNAFGTEKTRKFFTEKTYKYISFAALTFYCLAKSYSFYTGAHHLESGIPLGTPGAIISSGLILPLNICVGMVVACTMYAFYTLFRKEEF